MPFVINVKNECEYFPSYCNCKYTHKTSGFNCIFISICDNVHIGILIYISYSNISIYIFDDI